LEQRRSKWGYNYRRNIEKGFIFSLLITISIFVLSKRFSIEYSKGTKKFVPTIYVENIPKTYLGTPRKKRPKRPAIPIPVESESIPEDAVIEPTDLNFALDFGEAPTLGGAEPDVLPRPIAEVFPEYPEEDLNKGIEGIVKLYLHVDTNGKVIETVVLQNTTGSTRCADAASRAALRSRFIPAQKDNKAVAAWISKIYTFSASK